MKRQFNYEAVVGAVKQGRVDFERKNHSYTEEELDILIDELVSVHENDEAIVYYVLKAQLFGIESASDPEDATNLYSVANEVSSLDEYDIESRILAIRARDICRVEHTVSHIFEYAKRFSAMLNIAKAWNIDNKVLSSWDSIDEFVSLKLSALFKLKAEHNFEGVCNLLQSLELAICYIDAVINEMQEAHS